MLLFLTALLGRYSLDRFGLDQSVELRGVALSMLVILTLLWRATVSDRSYQHTWGSTGQLGLVFLGYQVSSALWAPPEARTAQLLVDIVAIAALFMVSLAITGPDRDRSARVLLYLMLGAGCAYAVLGLVLGQTTAQGRLSVLGGGPNVFVRVVILGVLAAFALAAIRRKPAILAVLPPLATAALLSGSRGGLLAGLLTMLAFAWLYRRRIRASRVLTTAVLAGTLSIAGLALLGDGAVGFLRDRYLPGNLAEANLSYRPELVEQAWTLFRERPLFGAGLDAFYGEYGYSGSWEYAHNFVASVGAEGGLVGLALLAVLLYGIARALGPITELSPERTACLLAAMYIFFASLFSGDYYDTRLAWIFIAVAANPQPTTRLFRARQRRA
jgi:O-antigen ligase